MALDAVGTGVPGLARGCSRLVGNLRKNFLGMRARTRGSRGFITPENFQEELVVLRLSGERFGPAEYASALARTLGISISIHVIPDANYPELARRLALSGRMGEVRLSEESGLAAVFVPESLPCLVSDLTVFHELGHLAAGDLLAATAPEQPADLVREHECDRAAEGFSTIRVDGKRLARGLPFASEPVREHEANLRASYAFIAGCLGEESPYAHRMYEVL